MHPEELAIIFVFSIPLFALWSNHRRKVLEMQLKLRGPAEVGNQSEIEALRHEVRGLRETSTQYDLSFDTALQRMEHRVEGIERRVQSIQSDDVLRVGNGR